MTSISNSNTKYKESGLVSIFTVIMFMIFISILVVGFIKIMTDEQRQTTDNDLSASALAAAQGGIEDGKRILLYCLSGASAGHTAACKAILESADAANPCSVFNDNGPMNGLWGAMKINNDGTITKVGNDEFAQGYTCLTIKSNPTKIEKDLTVTNSEIIPLNVDGNFDSVKVSWSNFDSSYGSKSSAIPSFAKLADWKDLSGNPLPPVLRVHAIPYVGGAVDLDQAEAESKSIFLVPTSAASGPVDKNAIDTRNIPGSTRSGSTPIAFTYCKTAPGPGYSCEMTIKGFDSATRKYFLRLSLLYADKTKISVKAIDTATGTERNFENVQYIIDVTGRANDVYRRIQTRVSPNAPSYYPEYAIDSSLPICKDMKIATLKTSYYCGITDPGVAGNANIGLPGAGAGGGKACYGVKPTYVNWMVKTCWQFRPINLTSADPADIAQCTWNWGDGNSQTFAGSAAPCKPCQTATCVPAILHEYTPTLPVGTFRNYSVKLTVILTDGSNTSKTTMIRRPR